MEIVNVRDLEIISGCPKVPNYLICRAVRFIAVFLLLVYVVVLNNHLINKQVTFIGNLIAISLREISLGDQVCLYEREGDAVSFN